MKIAVPVADEQLTVQYGMSKAFVIAAVEDCRIIDMDVQVPPEGDPGALPRWLKENGVHVLIAGGMGARAAALLQQNGIDVHPGALRKKPEELIMEYLDDCRGMPACGDEE